MDNQHLEHFDRAADHFRDAILLAQDVIYGMMGVIGVLIVAINSFELNAHPREAGTLFAVGAALIIVAVVRWAFRRPAGRVRA